MHDSVPKRKDADAIASNNSFQRLNKKQAMSSGQQLAQFGRRETGNTHGTARDRASIGVDEDATILEPRALEPQQVP
eukprot:SAG31_NODE_3870_length_3798_cov_2.788862_4_plen_77_part_00